METPKCDFRCQSLKTKGTSDYEDYYVGIAAYCMALGQPKYLTEVGIGTSYTEPVIDGDKLLKEIQLPKIDCLAPSIKKIPEAKIV